MPELERRWAIELQQNEPGNTWTDEQADAACAYTGEIAQRIHSIVPKTAEGWRVRAQAVAWQRLTKLDAPFSEPVPASYGYNDTRAAEKLVDDLRGVATTPAPAFPAPHPDQELLDVVEAYRKANNIVDHIFQKAPRGDPKGKALVISKAANADVIRHREQALKLYAWICGRCTREFTRANLRELTVHHINHDHDHNPPDGSNWELLCVYCHDEEHTKFENFISYGSVPETRAEAATFSPFAGLKDALNKRK